MKYISISLPLTIGQKIFFGLVLVLAIIILIINATMQPKATPTSNFYEDEDWDIITNYAEQQYGDICGELSITDEFKLVLISPTEELPFYKIVTLGAGAYNMEVPFEFEDAINNRAEYVIYLPQDWNIDSRQIEDVWPLETLSIIALYPSELKDVLAVGHTILLNEDESLIEGSKSFNSCLLLESKDKEGKNIMPVPLKTPGREVAFIQLYPLYPEELNFLLQGNPYTKLLDKIGDQLDYVVNEDRPNYCK